MNIIQVSERFPPSIGGVENYTNNISTELSKRGHNVTVFTSNIKNINGLFSAAKSHEKTEKIRERFNVRRFNVQPPYLPYMRNYAIIPSLIKGIVNLRPDIIHIQSWMLIHSDVVSILSKIRKIPFVMTIHSFGDEAPSPYIGPFMKLYQSTIGKMDLELSDRIIVLTLSAKEYLARLGIREDKIVVIPNGIYYDQFSNLSYNKFKRDNGINGKMVLFVGQLSYKKGVEYIIRSAPKILKEIPDVNFVLIGTDHGAKKSINKLATDLDITDNIILTGPVDSATLIDAYNECDVFVLPSKREGLPTVLLEAMASGKPVVSTNVGGIPSIVKDGANGFLTEFGNDAELANCIIKILSNKELSKKMGSQGKKIAIDFDWSRICDKIEKTYEDVIYEQY